METICWLNNKLFTHNPYWHTLYSAVMNQIRWEKMYKYTETLARIHIVIIYSHIIYSFKTRRFIRLLLPSIICFMSFAIIEGKLVIMVKVFVGNFLIYTILWQVTKYCFVFGIFFCFVFILFIYFFSRVILSAEICGWRSHFGMPQIFSFKTL